MTLMWCEVLHLYILYNPQYFFYLETKNIRADKKKQKDVFRLSHLRKWSVIHSAVFSCLVSELILAYCLRVLCFL